MRRAGCALGQWKRSAWESNIAVGQDDSCQFELKPRAIENPTLIERFVRLVPLPYPLASLFWAIVIGNPGFLLFRYLEIGESAFPTDVSGITSSILFLLVPFFVLFIVGYVRETVVSAEARIASRLAGGEKDYHEAFGLMTSNLAVLPLAVAFEIIVLPFTERGPLVGVFNIVALFIASLAFATYVWEFVTACYGIHRLGGSSLKLRSYLEERMMGARPLGSLVLSLTLAYFGAEVLLIALFYGPLLTNLSFQVVVIVLLIVGIALFVLPVNSIHKKMQEEKSRLLGEISDRILRLNASNVPTADEPSLKDVHNALTRMTDLQQLELLDRKVSSLPTWPYDVQIVSRFITIVLSVTAVLLSRIITGFLHI